LDQSKLTANGRPELERADLVAMAPGFFCARERRTVRPHAIAMAVH
jgi:hypothetical protein